MVNSITDNGVLWFDDCSVCNDTGWITLEDGTEVNCLECNK